MSAPAQAGKRNRSIPATTPLTLLPGGVEKPRKHPHKRPERGVDLLPGSTFGWGWNKPLYRKARNGPLDERPKSNLCGVRD